MYTGHVTPVHMHFMSLITHTQQSLINCRGYIPDKPHGWQDQVLIGNWGPGEL